MKNILRSIAILLVSIASSSYTMGDKSRFDAGMGIGLSAPSISVSRLGTQMEERQAEHEPRQLTRFEQGIVKKVIEKIEDAFKKADSQGRAAAYNLLGLPFEIQVEILNSLTPQERSDIANMSQPHQELITKYNKQRIERFAQMQTALKLTYLGLLDLDSIVKLGKAFPNIKRLTIGGIRLFPPLTSELLSKTLKVSFPQLELIEIEKCDPSENLLFDKWKKDKPGRTVICLPLRHSSLSHITTFTSRSGGINFSYGAQKNLGL